MNSSELKALRLCLGLSQSELAQRLFITRDAVSKLEAGKNRMSRPVEELARQLSITPPLTPLG